MSLLCPADTDTPADVDSSCVLVGESEFSDTTICCKKPQVDIRNGMQRGKLLAHRPSSLQGEQRIAQSVLQCS